MNYDELCQHVTQTIIDTIEQGDLDEWSAPWHNAGTSWLPVNANTGAYYRGSNVITLACAAVTMTAPDRSSPSPYWATYRQWSDLDAQVRKGERSTSIVKWIPKRSRTDDDRPTTPDGRPMLALDDLTPRLLPKVYAVFHADQVDGWQAPVPPTPRDHERIESAENWIEASGVDISSGHDHACYRLSSDRVEVPAISQYDNVIDYYGTVCHELVHSTAHPDRLNRELGCRFGDDAYAAEELIAELGAAFTTARLGLSTTPRPDHAQYVSHWLRILRTDTKALFAAAAQAQRAVDYLADLAVQAKAAQRELTG